MLGIRKVLAGVWAAAVFVLAVCHLNHPRLWIQDLLCSASLYWIPFVGADFLRRLAKAFVLRRSTVLALALVITEGYLILRVSELAMPYVRARSLPTSQTATGPEVSVLFSHVDFAPEGLTTLVREVSSRKPTVVVLVGEHPKLDAAQKALPPFTAVLETSRAGSRGIRLFSQIAPLPDGERDLGFDALPSLVVKLPLDSSVTLIFGALDLLPAFSHTDYFKSKVTSRRMATIMRYATDPEIVVGNFEATPFSPLVSMYARQVRVHSVMRGFGLFRTFDIRNPFVRMTLDNAFVSRGTHVMTCDVFSGISASRYSLAWTERIDPTYRALRDGVKGEVTHPDVRATLIP